MAFLDGIFGKPAPQQQPAQVQPGPNGTGMQQGPQQGQQPAAPAPQNQNGSAGPASQQQVNGNSQMGTGSNGAPSGDPLDIFAKMMTPSADVVKERTTQQTQKEATLFGDRFSPENVQKAVSTVNFAQSLDPAKVTAALGGDHNAFMEVLNSAVQAGVTASVQMSHGMVEQGVKTGNERFSSEFDSRARDYSLRNQNASNPAFSHPVGKALLSTVARQIAEANPKMSPEEVSRQSEAMFSQFAESITSAGKSKEQASGPKEMDWTQFTQ